MKHSLILKPNPNDWLMGDGHIAFKSVCSDWSQHIDFYEGQLVENGDTDDCVIFTAQESFDAQMDNLFPTFPPEVQQQISAMGFMDMSSVDNKPHFHSSPRFLGVLTGNGTNGNALPDPWNVFRKYGCVPWAVLPVNPTMTVQEYFAPIEPNVMAIGAKFLALIGGTNAIQYHYAVNGAENLQAMRNALPQAPLCIGVNVDDSQWNQYAPGFPPPGNPVHSVMLYSIDASGNCLVYDHYQPAKKMLLVGYNIPYALQGIVTPVFAAPTPPVLPPNPVIPAAPTIQPDPTTPQILSWLSALLQWLGIIQKETKGLNTNNKMLKSLTPSGHGVLHFIVTILVFAGSYALMAGGAWQTITLGSALNGIIMWLKNKYLMN